MGRRTSTGASFITVDQAISGAVAAVLVPVASQGGTADLGDVLTNLGSYGRGLYGQGRYGNQR